MSAQRGRADAALAPRLHRARRDARRHRRRPARPHVRARGAVDGLSHRGARPRSAQPGRPGRARAHPRRLPRPAGARSPRRRAAPRSPPSSRTCRRRRWRRWRRAGRSRRPPRRSPCARTAPPRRRIRAQRRRLRAARVDRLERARSSTRVADALLPGILKTARLGYDGKGQRAVADRAGAGGGLRRARRRACVLEKRLPLAAEISVIVARGARRRRRPPAGAGEPPSRRHPRRHRACRRAASSRRRCRTRRSRCAERLAAALDYVGVLCVEFFVLADGSLVANEMAPRPHNSGHYSIDACDLSQFELQVRAMTGAPLVAPRLHSPCVMLNLLGDLWLAGGAAPSPTGAACWRCPARTCTSTARARRGPAARWAT